MRSINCWLIVLIGIFTFFVQASGQMREDLQWVTELVENSRATSAEERQALIGQIINRLDRHTEGNADIRELISVLDTTRELLRLEADSLIGRTNNAVSATNKGVRDRELGLLRRAMLDRVSALLGTIHLPDLTPKDAKKITEFAKYASQALDDVRDPSLLGGASSPYTKLYTRLSGIASLAASVKDPEARSILSGLRGTLGTMDKKLTDLGVSAGNPMKAFDIPAEVAGAIIDTSRKGMDQASAALDDITRAIGGDAEALARMSGHSQMIEKTLSPQTYGNAMFKAITDRLIDRIPFLRALAKLIIGPDPHSASTNAGTSGKTATLDWFVSGSADFLNEEDIYICEANPRRTGSRFLDGTHRYMKISGVCWAAVHTGAITAEKGGKFRIRFFPYEEGFSPRASVLNGVTSGDYGWSSLKMGTFVILKVE
jgi:hypothetical protein